MWKDLNQFEIDQIWAEAVQVWKDGERPTWSRIWKLRRCKQEQHTEESSKAGLILEYLDTLLPEN